MRQTIDQQHTTHIEQRLGKWHVRCDRCGKVGQPEEFEGDAEAIAERHNKVGGFG